MRKVSLLALVAIALSLCAVPATATSSTTVVAVGDIARSGGGQNLTAQLTTNINPDRVLLLGDLAYSNGSTSNFKNYFTPSWGSVLNRHSTFAVPGNHEYRTSRATGYREIVARYGLPKTAGNLWWSRNVNGWTIIGLDSERSASSTQKQFLKDSLKANNGRPTIVLWHKPTYTRGEHQSDRCATKTWWNIVAADNDVKMLLWGHDHDYEQLDFSATSKLGTYPQVDCSSQLAQPNHEMTTFVVGTGGAELRTCDTANIPGQLLCGTNKRNYGVLKLKLAIHSYSWSFRRIDDFTQKPASTGIQKDSGSHSF